jgi:hypothetical protein
MPRALRKWFLSLAQAIDLERAASLAKKRRFFLTSAYILRNQLATARGSNRTQVPILKLGMRPAFAILKIVMRETDRYSATSTAVRAREIFSI